MSGFTLRSLMGLLGAVLVLGACSGGTVDQSSTSTNGTSSTTSSIASSTTSTIQGLDLSESAWVTHGLEGIRLDDGSLICQTQPFPADIVRDRQGGLVFSDSTGLWWFRSGEAEPFLISEDTTQLVSVISSPRGPVVMTLEGPSFYLLSSGEQVEAPEDVSIAVPNETPWLWEWTAANGLTAQVTDPEVNTDQEGQPTDILEPAHLIVSRGDEVLVDLPIGTGDEAWVRIHDFDGQRIIISRGPFEPAMPEETFLLIDLATGSASELFVASATRAAFTGADTDWTGPVQQPDPTQ